MKEHFKGQKSSLIRVLKNIQKHKKILKENN